MTDRVHDVVLVGDSEAATELLAAGIHDFFIFDRDVVSAVFADDTDTWTLTCEDGEVCRGRIVIACESPFVPLLPDMSGRRDFRGSTMHAAMPSNFFEPNGKRVAVIGADSSAGALIERMTAAGATVEVFPLAPRRRVHKLRRRLRLPRKRRVTTVSSPVEEITAVGVRTADGIHHDADAIVYGTGFAVRAGLPQDTLVGAHGVSIQQAWVNGAEPYRGVALHGFPNYFTAGGPDFTTELHYIVECLRLLGGHTRIEVRRSAQGVFNERVHLQQHSWQLDASAFDVSASGGMHNDGYEGTATLTAPGITEQVRVALSGYFEPIDGQYHWRGTVFGSLPDEINKARSVTVAANGRCAEARITEHTPQGTHSIAGVGEPPFPVSELQLA